MMDTVTILLKYVAPSVGCVTAIINYFSPMPRVWQVRREKVLKVSITFAHAFTYAVNYVLFIMRVQLLLTRVAGTLQEFNPLPVAMITANCIGWTIYACIIGDAFVFAVNFPGFLMGLYMVATCAQYASQKVGHARKAAYCWRQRHLSQVVAVALGAPVRCTKPACHSCLPAVPACLVPLTLALPRLPPPRRCRT
jgi:hypothetical protein